MLRLAPWHSLNQEVVDRFCKLAVGVISALREHLERPSTTNYSLLSTMMTSEGDQWARMENHDLPNQTGPHSPPSIYGKSISGSSGGAGGSVGGCRGSQLSQELLERLMHASRTFPPFTPTHHQALEDAYKGGKDSWSPNSARCPQ